MTSVPTTSQGLFVDSASYWNIAANEINRVNDLLYAGETLESRTAGTSIDLRRGCALYHSTTQTISSGSWTSLPFNTESWDSDSFHDTATNNSRITIPTGLGGLYIVTTHARLSQTRYFISRVYKNNDTMVFAHADYEIGSDTGTILLLSAGDYIELQIFQSEGFDLTATTYKFGLTLIGV